MWGQGSSFPACSNCRGVLLQAKQARRCSFASCCLSKAALETKLPGSGGQGTASEWNVPSWFKVQSPEPEGPGDHSRPPAHAPSILLPTFFHFHLPLPVLLRHLVLPTLITQMNAAESPTRQNNN